MSNGRFWLALAEGQKLTWLFGYSDGSKTAAAFVGAAEPSDKLLAQYILDFQPIDKLTAAEWVGSIDRFYQDTPENGPVPVAGAMQYIKRKASGATSAELDALAASLRKANATPPDKKP
jgi:hypothetical protein